MDAAQKNDFLLAQLIFMFQSAAMQQMGKIKNPFNDKIDRDLAQAQISIDMLDMIHMKMKGNLSAEEERMFTQVLQDLRLNYVDEASKQAPAPEPPKNSDPALDPPAASDPVQAS